MFGTILVATDGSAAAGRALEAAIDLARRYDARLYIVHVQLHGRPVAELERMAEIEHLVPEVAPRLHPAAVPAASVADLTGEAEQAARVVAELGHLILARARSRAIEAGLSQVALLLQGGDYADSILDAVDESGADLLVMGRRGLGKLRQLLLGSVSNKVAQQAGCAVLLVQ